MSSKRRSGSETRNDILDAGWDLVSQRGAEASISQIAAAAGVSRQAIYLHFGTRGGLLIALVRRADELYAIREAFQDAQGRSDPIERLDAAIRAWLEFVPRILPVARDLIRLKSTDDDARAAWEDRMAELKSWMETLTLSLGEDDALAEGWSAKQASEFLWAHLSVQKWILLVEECGWPPEAAADRLRRTAISLLIKPARLDVLRP